MKIHLFYGSNNTFNSRAKISSLFFSIFAVFGMAKTFGQPLLLDFQFEQSFAPTTNELNGTFSINGNLSGPNWVNGTPSHGYLIECSAFGESGWSPEFSGWSPGEALVFSFNTLGRSNLVLQICERAPFSGVNLFGTMELWGSYGNGFELLWPEWTVTENWNASWDILPLPIQFENKPLVTIEIRKKNSPGSQSYGFRIDNFQVYTLSGLPVDLLDFTGHHAQGSNIIQWVTASEINNRQFIVERRTDETGWLIIGTIDGQGNSRDEHNYEFIDETPFPNSYYRLRQTDYDGRETFSETIQVTIQGTAPSVLIFPNPTHDFLHLHHNGVAASSPLVRIYNSTGRLMIEKKLDGDTLDITVLPSGIYNMVIESDQHRAHQRFLKQ